MATQNTTSSTTISEGKTRVNTAYLRRQFERLAADAINLYVHQQHIGEAHPAASATYRYALSERTQRLWHLPQVISPFTQAEATHLEVHLSVEDGGKTWEARLSWIMPYVATGPASDWGDAPLPTTICLSWIEITREGERPHCTDFAATWRDPALYQFAEAALTAAASGLLEVSAPSHSPAA